MMFDFSDLPFFDNHTHLLNVTNREIDMKDYIGPFNHGYVDNLPDDVPFNIDNCAGNNKPQCISDDMLENTVKNLGICKAFVNYASQFMGVECDFDAVLKERNRRSMEDMVAYTKSLYEDQQIIAEVVDSPLPMGDPALGCFPTKVLRLFQTDGIVAKLTKECESYAELEARFDQRLRYAILEEKFCGVKCHPLEINRRAPHYVSPAEAEKVFRAAKYGDPDAAEEVYHAAFCHMLQMTQELDFPVHLHTGITGKTTYKNLNLYDPLCFAPLLNDKRFYKSHLVFLHMGYPNIRSASYMCQGYPNVWIDIAQVLPWEVFNITSILEDAMGFASHGKITIGTGAHFHPEINWMSAKIAKKALAFVLEDAVNKDFMNKKQAEQTAELLLFKNAQRLYQRVL